MREEGATRGFCLERRTGSVLAHECSILGVLFERFQPARDGSAAD